MNVVWWLFLLGLVVGASSSCSSKERFEAEKAHLLRRDDRVGDNFRSGDYVEVRGGDCIIFTVNIPTTTTTTTTTTTRDSEYNIIIGYRSTSEATLEVYANGHSQKKVSSGPTPTSSVGIVETIGQLREGINTIVLSNPMGPAVSVDYIEVPGSVPLSSRGATLPYTEYEAESAVYSGTVIGPDRTYLQIPAEASNRMAVQLHTSTDFVEFTVQGTANAVVVRFSIPDTPDGKGMVATLGVVEAGQSLANLTVTSKWSWAYGNYPFTKNPSDGRAHHFFDEARGIFSRVVPAGSKVRLVPLTPGVTYTIDLADFYMIPAPYPMPSNFVSVIDFGADPTGKKDSTSAFQNAINSAQSSNKGLWIPEGTFAVTRRFTVDNIIVRGAGPWYSVVQATVPHGVGFFGNSAPNPSHNVQIYDFSIIGDTNVRIDSVIDSGIGGSFTNSIIQNVWIEHTKCGIWVDGPASSLHVVGLVIRNTYADGINLHKGISNTVVEQSMLRNLGDDGLAMWSDAVADDSNRFSFNTIQMPVLANGIAIYGGHNNAATDNFIADIITEGAGLQVSNRFGSVLLSGVTEMSRNYLLRCGSPNSYNTAHSGAIWLWPSDGPMNSFVNFSNSDIIDSSFAAVTFWGSQLTDTHMYNMRIKGAPYAVEVNSIQGQAYFSAVVATGLTKGGIYSCDSAFKLNQDSSCSGWSDSHCNYQFSVI